MLRTLSLITLVIAGLALVPLVAGAAGVGDTILLSGPAGLDPLDPALGAWNASGRAELAHGSSSDDVTADGHFAVFTSTADGLAPGEDLGVSHIFRKDLVTGALTVVDAGSNGSAADPAVSDDGRYVAFTSLASNLAATDTTRDADVFVKDLLTGTVTLITPAAAATPSCFECLRAAISGNGDLVAFATAAALDAGDGGTRSDVYARQRTGGAYTLVSATPGGVTSSNGESAAPSITTDGTTVAFTSTATDIDPGNDPNNGTDIYVRVLAATLASAQDGNTFGVGAGGVNDGQISGDGTRVVFTDNASYVAGDTDAFNDVYRRTLATKVTELVSVSTAGTDADAAAFSSATDASGARVAFISAATNLGGTVSGNDLYVRDTGSSTTAAVTDAGGGVAAPSLSDGAGAKVVFFENAVLADGPTPSAIHAAPIGGGAPSLVSAPNAGPALRPQLTAVSPINFTQSERRLSADGRYAVFASGAAALGTPVIAINECWRRDLRTGALDLVSTAGAGGAAIACQSPTISADGTRVAFVTQTPLTADDGAPNDADVYVRDLTAGTTTFVSRADGAAGANSDGLVGDAEISADGRRVGFTSSATNLGEPGGGPGKYHIYVRDLAANTIQIADRFQAGGAVGDKPLDGFTEISLSADGGRVAFNSNAQLVTTDTDLLPDVYVRDLAAATTTLISVQSAAAGGAKGVLGSSKAVISGDGRRVAFDSSAQNLEPALAPWPVSASFEIFLRDVDAQTTTMVSRSASGTVAGDASAFNAAIDASGDVVAFAGNAVGLTTNVTPDVTDGGNFIVVRRMASGTTQTVHVPPIEPENGLPGIESPVLSEDGRCLGYFARGRNLVLGLSPDFTQMFARPLQGDCGTLAPLVTGPAVPQTPPGAVVVPISASGPQLSNVSLSRTRFRVGPKATVLSARRKPGVGTTVRFTIGSLATVKIRFARAALGRRSGVRCVVPTRKLARAKRCTRQRPEGTLTRRGLKAAAYRVPFSGRIGKRALAPGAHVATLVATNTAGVATVSKPLAFTIVAR